MSLQLNNGDGRTILLEKIDILQNRIVYNIFEYGNNEPKSQECCVFKNIVLKDYLEKKTNFEELCYINLALEKETGFEVSSDVQNWTIKKGLNGEDTVLRAYIPQDLINKHIHKESDLGLLFTAMKPCDKFKQILGNGAMQYLVTILDTSRATLAKYPSIILEEKI